MIELYAELEDYILRDIVRRIMKAGRITATADRMIWLLRQMGEQQNEIQKKLAEMMGITQAELRRLLQGAVMTSWQDDLGTLSMITNTPGSSPLENPRVMSVMDAEYRKSLGELRNLTRTTMTAANSDLVRLLDEAEMRVASGAQSYSQAIIDVLDNYAGEGLKVTYPSGRRISLEAAVRMCVVTSMNQTAAQVTNQYIVEAGTNYVLVSAHIGARVRTEKQPPCAGHDEWQGKVYCIRGSEEGFPNLLEATGYDIDPVTGMGTVVNPLGLHGYNCRHGHRPFDKDLRNPYQNPDGSQKIDTKENERMFDLLQRQRAMERAIRRTKRELLVKQNEVDLEPDADRKAALQRQADDIQARLWKQNRAYNDFCRKNGLATQYDRTHLASGGIKQDVFNNDTHDRARNIKTVNDLLKVSDSSIISMKSYTEIQKYFSEKYNISISGFEKKKLFDVTATLAGYDDMFREFPEAVKYIKEIKYNPHISANGNIHLNTKLSEVGKSGLRDYGTGIHEAAHSLDFVRSKPGRQSYAEMVVEKARKNLKFRPNSINYKNLRVKAVGPVDNASIYDNPTEIFAYAIETAKGGIENELAAEIYRITLEGIV